jgi:hypothetical protein
VPWLKSHFPVQQSELNWQKDAPRNPQQMSPLHEKPEQQSDTLLHPPLKETHGGGWQWLVSSQLPEQQSELVLHVTVEPVLMQQDPVSHWKPPQQSVSNLHELNVGHASQNLPAPAIGDCTHTSSVQQSPLLEHFEPGPAHWQVPLVHVVPGQQSAFPFSLQNAPSPAHISHVLAAPCEVGRHFVMPEQQSESPPGQGEPTASQQVPLPVRGMSVNRHFWPGVQQGVCWLHAECTP